MIGSASSHSAAFLAARSRFAQFALKPFGLVSLAEITLTLYLRHLEQTLLWLLVSILVSGIAYSLQRESSCVDRLGALILAFEDAADAEALPDRPRRSESIRLAKAVVQLSLLVGGMVALSYLSCGWSWLAALSTGVAAYSTTHALSAILIVGHFGPRTAHPSPSYK